LLLYAKTINPGAGSIVKEAEVFASRTFCAHLTRCGRAAADVFRGRCRLIQPLGSFFRSSFPDAR
jgi:hypothetical protein